MASVGPQLPPSLAVKRKRDEESDTLNDHSETSTPSKGRSVSPDSSAKRSRTIGPTLPPASLDERPVNGPEEDTDTSSDDDDFGPRLPGAGESAAGSDERTYQALSEPGPQVSSKNQRDEWMTLPPSNGDWSARIDTTKLKARKFNSGKGASSQSATTGGDNKWTETPAEKIARLEREVMGITDPTAAKPKVPPPASVKTAAVSQKLQEHTGKSRGPSLYDEHQKSKSKSKSREKEDDPSARPFDREKDIGGGTKINSTQLKEMMKRAGDFGSRFSSAKY